MISCDECQRKMVALLDHEGDEGDRDLVSSHFQECDDCRRFWDDMVGIRREFVSLPAISMPAKAEERLICEAESDLSRGRPVHTEKLAAVSPRPRRFRRMVWVGGAVALSAVTVLTVVCLILSEKVETLRHKLEITRGELALSQAQQHLRQTQEAQTKEQTAISTLNVRMEQLEQRFERIFCPMTVSHPEGYYPRSESLWQL